MHAPQIYPGAGAPGGHAAMPGLAFCEFGMRHWPAGWAGDAAAFARRVQASTSQPTPPEVAQLRVQSCRATAEEVLLAWHPPPGQLCKNGWACCVLRRACCTRVSVVFIYTAGCASPQHWARVWEAMHRRSDGVACAFAQQPAPLRAPIASAARVRWGRRLQTELECGLPATAHVLWCAASYVARAGVLRSVRCVVRIGVECRVVCVDAQPGAATLVAVQAAVRSAPRATRAPRAAHCAHVVLTMGARGGAAHCAWATSGEPWTSPRVFRIDVHSADGRVFVSAPCSVRAWECFRKQGAPHRRSPQHAAPQLRRPSERRVWSSLLPTVAVRAGTPPASPAGTCA